MTNEYDEFGRICGVDVLKTYTEENQAYTMRLQPCRQGNQWVGYRVAVTGGSYVSEPFQIGICETLLTCTDEPPIPEPESCYALMTTVDPAGSGEVEASPTPNCGDDKYEAGTQVQLTAKPKAGYKFVQWTGAASGSNPTVTLTMNGNETATATFGSESESCYSLTTTVDPAGSGEVEASPTPNCGDDKYEAGTQVQLTAKPKAGYKFVQWTGAASGSSPTVTLTMNGNETATATFGSESESCYSLTTTVDPAGSGKVEASPTPNCGNDKYEAGTRVQLTAKPEAGYKFMQWTAALSGTMNPADVTMDGDKTISVTFTKDTPEPEDSYEAFLPITMR